MEMRPLGRSGLTVAPIVFGGNVFGWTADEKTSFALLDAFVDHGFNGIDTADVYSRFVEGNEGGESETIIGKWLKANPDKRDRIVLMTKVGMDMGPGGSGLSRSHIMDAVDASLRRLQTDVIDLYQSHRPDGSVDDEETLSAYRELIEAGKVRAIGCSNFSAKQVRAALDTAKRNDLPRYETLQPEFNLYDRDDFDDALRETAAEEELGVITYFSLASGFLSGKYRSKADLKKSQRGSRVEKYLDARGMSILDALDSVSNKHDAKPAEVALAWVIASPGVTAPIASATSHDQLESLAKAATLTLDADDMSALDAAGR
ncbi:aldo/keto reductase [Pararhizobium mangrovi]|uniref:Aldo/keto reductase n=1 Tax=Pararhizobium mangrovi TaxID=2590452 RepID=A0A506TYW1_9HYPH|nr:aldo/keto reductase [Pararhizobium mangrovi]TPW26506.1 aldo/keto reductase [Pararhizobium mangrovi]